MRHVLQKPSLVTDAMDAHRGVGRQLKRSAILAAFLLAACGQRGPLYLPQVPPLPPPPDMTHATPGAERPGASDAASDAGQTGTQGAEGNDARGVTVGPAQ